MSLSDLRRLFSLETLDTRFFVPATAPPKDALQETSFGTASPLPSQNGRSRGKGSTDNVQPPRWKTPEYYFYYAVIAICVPFMFKSVIDVSKGLLHRECTL